MLEQGDSVSASDENPSCGDPNSISLRPISLNETEIQWSRGESSSSRAERGGDANSDDRRLLHFDLNVVSEYGEGDNDECRIVERPNAYISTGSSHQELQSGSRLFGLPSENEEDIAAASSLENRHRLCKRRAVEVQAGSSSGSGTPSLVINNDSWQLNGRGAEAEVRNSSNGSIQQQEPVLISRQNVQSRWNGSDPMVYRRSVYETPLLSSLEMGRSSVQQHPVNWILNGHRSSSSIAENTDSTSSLRSFSRYPRRLSRSLLLSQSMEFRSRSRSHGVGSSSSSPTVDTPPVLPGSGNIIHPVSGVRSTSMMSEIRHVLDLMRRGEALRIEDLMAFDHSILFGMSDIHNRHRDMRLDVDGMSYEELLALEEQIGSVCTGLKEETIATSLKQKKYRSVGDTGHEVELESEPCSICREEYVNGEEMGVLDCGHEFHRDCIKQWLVLKNLCPICKTTGLFT